MSLNDTVVYYPPPQIFSRSCLSGVSADGVFSLLSTTKAFYSAYFNFGIRFGKSFGKRLSFTDI